MTIKDLEYCLKSLGKKYPSPPFLSKEESRELDAWHEETFRWGGPQKEGENVIMYLIRLGRRLSLGLGEGLIGIIVAPLVILLLPFWCILRAFGGFRI